MNQLTLLCINDMRGSLAGELQVFQFNVVTLQVMGLPRKGNYSGRWDVLIDKSTKCLTRLMGIASKKKRNYILDQVVVHCFRPKNLTR